MLNARAIRPTLQGRAREKMAIGSLGVVGSFGVVQKLPGLVLGHTAVVHACCSVLRILTSGSDSATKFELLRAVVKRNLIVRVDDAVLVPFKYCPVASHSKCVQLRGTECSHAGTRRALRFLHRAHPGFRAAKPKRAL